MGGGNLGKCSVIALAVVLTVAFVAGCQTASKRDIGTGIGAGLGALLGAKIDDGGIGGILVGAAVGGVIGRVIGSYMDDADREKLAETLNSTPTGETEYWKNEDTGYEYALTPTTGTYPRGDDQCRDFEQEVFIDGKRELIQASACRQTEDETWAIEA
jgi:surface antigen